MSAAYDHPHDAYAWEPTRLLTLAEARRRTKSIRFWRWVFTAVAAGAVLLVLGFAGWASIGGDMSFTREIEAKDALKMVNPRFTGRANNGQSYIVTAETAVRRSRTSDIVDLDDPVFEGSRGASARAPKGVYKESNGAMELTGGVVFMDKSGNRFDTADAMFDSARDRVTGSGSIHGSGPIGSLRADAYEMQASGGRVIMRGNVRGTIKESDL